MSKQEENGTYEVYFHYRGNTFGIVHAQDENEAYVKAEAAYPGEKISGVIRDNGYSRYPYTRDVNGVIVEAFWGYVNGELGLFPVVPK